MSYKDEPVFPSMDKQFSFLKFSSAQAFLVSVPVNRVSDNVCSINVIKTAHFNRNRNLSLNLTKGFYAGHEAPKAAPDESVIPQTLPLLQPPSVDTCGLSVRHQRGFLNLYLAMKWKSLDLEYALWGVPWAEISSAPGANSTQKRFTWVQKGNLLPDLSCGALRLLLWGLLSLWTYSTFSSVVFYLQWV